jgi:hypothetical protein
MGTDLQFQHLVTKLYNSLRPQDVHDDGDFQPLVKLDCGRGMKHDRHAVRQNLLVSLAHAQLGKGDVSIQGHQFVQSFWAFLSQPVKNLQNNKKNAFYFDFRLM